MNGISEGSFGAVSKVKYEDSNVAVLKVAHKSTAISRRMFKHEAEMMAMANGAGRVPRILALGWDKPAMVMTYCTHPSLENLVQRDAITTMPQFLSIFKSTAKCLRALHKAGIVHCDIKEDNILVNLNKSKAYIIDLGLAVKINEKCHMLGKHKMSTHEQHKHYDPVIWVGGRATPATDVYSLGYIFKDLMEMWVNDKVFPAVDQEILTLCDTMMDYDPAKRPSIKVVIITLSRRLRLLTGGGDKNKSHPSDKE